MPSQNPAGGLLLQTRLNWRCPLKLRAFAKAIHKLARGLFADALWE